MNAKNLSQPDNLLDESFDPSEMHPADIAQVIEAPHEEYNAIPPRTFLRAKYRNAVNKLVDLLTEKRQFRQYAYL